MRYVAITSGKGGVGKSTVAINLATSLSKYGRQVILVDANFDFPNIGLMLGKSGFEETIISCIEGNKELSRAIYKHQCGIRIIPGSISMEHYHKRDIQKFTQGLSNLKEKAEALFLDMASGLQRDNLEILKNSHDLIVVTTPDFISVTETLKLLKVAKMHNKRVLGVVVNRHTGKDYDMRLDNIHTLLGEKVIGVIPEHRTIREALKLKYPVVYSHPISPASVAFDRLACNLIGVEYKEKTDISKKGKMSAVLDKIGLKKWYDSLMEEDDEE